MSMDTKKPPGFSGGFQIVLESILFAVFDSKHSHAGNPMHRAAHAHHADKTVCSSNHG